MTNEAKVFDQIVQDRRSVRTYQQDIDYDKNIVKRSLERAILSPNSSNMQLWEFYRITSDDAKKEMAHYCLNQRTATTASELVVFVARPDKVKQSVNFNLDSINHESNWERESSKDKRRMYYKKVMPLFYSRDFLYVLSALKKLFVFLVGLKRPIVREVGINDKRVTIHKSVGLAAQTFMMSVKAEGYDTCPMEGVDSKRIKKMLNLPRRAQINMVISVGKGKHPEGIWYPRWRFTYDQVVKEI